MQELQVEQWKDLGGLSILQVLQKANYIPYKSSISSLSLTAKSLNLPIS